MTSSKMKSDSYAGILLVASAALAIFTILHHPEEHAQGQSALNAVVHGTMIAVLAVMCFGFTHFAIRSGLDNARILAGLVAYIIYVSANLIAATMNGFIAPGLATRHDTSAGREVLALCWEINQASAILGVWALGAAFTLWGIDFLARTGLWNRLIGVTGIMCGLLPLLLLAQVQFRLDVHTALFVYTSHAAWTIVVGVHILRSGLSNCPR